MAPMIPRLLSVLTVFALAPVAHSGEFCEAFDGDLSAWSHADTATWQVREGVAISPPAGGVSGLLLSPVHAAAARVRVDVLLPEEGRRNPAIAFGMQPDGSGYVVRWYDQRDWLELLHYDRGRVIRVAGNHWQAASPQGSGPQKPGVWYTMAVDVLGKRVRAKVWPRGEDEPGWQLEADCPRAEAGRCGLGIDETVARFDNFVALTGTHVADLVREEREARAALRRRARSVVLHGDMPPEARLSARFASLGSSAPPAELVFMAADAHNYYFVRADSGGICLGKVRADHETILATSDRDWHDGARRHELEVLATESDRDGRGPAWFLNRDHVPPMVCLRARIDRERGWDVTVHGDPVLRGKIGERYWDLDPFANSSAARPFGLRVGRRKAPGVRWFGLEIAAERGPTDVTPSVTPVQRITTGERGGCWLALGDLDGDQRLDYLVARNESQRVTALTAYANDGRELWRWGEGGGADIGYDVPAIIYDIDLDGAAEALCSIEGYLLVLDGSTGREERRWPLPEGLAVADCLIIANLRGLSTPADIIIKTRYDRAWAYTNDWKLLWEFAGNTGHHPDVADVDGDGRDEALCGFALIDDDGSLLWRQDLPGHADAARLVRLTGPDRLAALNTCCGGNDMALTSLGGETLWRQRPAITDFHFQTVHVGEIRPDVPGRELIVDEGWARPARARLVLMSQRREWLGALYVSYPRFHRLVDWDADGVMEIVIPSDGIVCDGTGRPVLRLEAGPILGGPGKETPMVHVADVIGDGRDELIVFNSEEIAVFTNPATPARPIPPQPAVLKRHYNATYY
jgi:hypothetical protein